jgi:hypothetical protein
VLALAPLHSTPPSGKSKTGYALTRGRAAAAHRELPFEYRFHDAFVLRRPTATKAFARRRVASVLRGAPLENPLVVSANATELRAASVFMLRWGALTLRQASQRFRLLFVARQ